MFQKCTAFVDQVFDHLRSRVVMFSLNSLNLHILGGYARRTTFELRSSVNTFPVAQLLAPPIQRILVTFVQQQWFPLPTAYELYDRAVGLEV